MRDGAAPLSTCLPSGGANRGIYLMPIGTAAGLIALSTLFQAGAEPSSATKFQRVAAWNSYATPVQHGPDRKLSAGRFLVASPSLRDPNFAKTVVLLTDYSNKGAIGLIINRATDVRLADVLPETDGLENRSDTIYVGGPVARRGMMLLIRSDESPKNAQRVLDGLYLSSSRAVLEKMITEGGRDRFRVFSGHSGWGPGQLANEMEQGAWHVFPADTPTVFDPNPSDVWQRLIDQTKMRFALADPIHR
jgi:putative transcriptional regulator